MSRSRRTIQRSDHASAEQDAVNAMIDQGLPLDHIAEYIEMLALSDDQRAALWMLAWAEVAEPADRQQFVARVLRDDRPTARWFIAAQRATLRRWRALGHSPLDAQSRSARADMGS